MTTDQQHQDRERSRVGERDCNGSGPVVDGSEPPGEDGARSHEGEEGQRRHGECTTPVTVTVVGGPIGVAGGNPSTGSAGNTAAATIPIPESSDQPDPTCCRDRRRPMH